MSKIMVEIYLPASGETYDVKIPANSRIGQIIPLLEKCMLELADGYFVPGDSTVLCERTTGTVLSRNLTVSEMGIVNGTRLMII